jgi:hypothetical protein
MRVVDSGDSQTYEAARGNSDERERAAGGDKPKSPAG